MIVSITGKINSGKDTVAKIIQIISQNPHFDNSAVIKFLDRKLYPGKWENKKWADKLKDIVCILLNCTREQLEDREFKEKELGPEWKVKQYSILDDDCNTLFNTFYEETAKQEYDFFNSNFTSTIYITEEDIVLTPRLLLQLIGTDCMRNIIHPDIWVNALMSEYRAKGTDAMLETTVYDYSDCEFPQWIISDTRFPNELEAVQKRKGLLIKIERDYALRGAESDPNKLHYSETALNYFQSWDYVIVNDYDLLTLIKNIRQILIIEELI